MSIEILAKQFSKDNKIGFDKALAFAMLVLANAPKSSAGTGRGKQVGQEALRVRAAIKAEGQNLRYMGLFTAKQLAEKLNTDPSTAINALNYLHKNEGVVIRAGQRSLKKKANVVVKRCCGPLPCRTGQENLKS